MSARERLEQIWWRRDEPRWAEAWLWPLSLLSLGYRAGAALARAGSRPARAAAPPISGGNLSVGGAGKTPVTLALAQRLLARGRKPAVLSRGYGGSSRGRLTIVSDGSGPLVGADLAGDEPALLARRLPGLRVLVGPRRALLAQEAIGRGADALLLDDGLQHHGLARDLDVLVVDASNPLGNARLLPRGPLREGLRTLERLAGRGLLWLTRSDLRQRPDPELESLVARARVLTGRVPVESSFAPAAGAPDLAGRRIFLLAGIARPASFEALARRLGADVAATRWFADHHRFSTADLEAVQAEAKRTSADLILTTEKDATRLPTAPGAGVPIAALPVELRVEQGEASIQAALDAALQRAR